MVVLEDIFISAVVECSIAAIMSSHDALQLLHIIEYKVSNITVANTSGCTALVYKTRRIAHYMTCSAWEGAKNN